MVRLNRVWGLILTAYTSEDCIDWFDARADSLEKTLMLGKIEGRRRRGMTENEMVG